MQPRTTAILFLVAAALGAFVYLYEIKGEEARSEEEEAGRRIFPGLVAEEVAFLMFRTEDDRAFEAVRVGEGWQIQQPVQFSGDAVNLNAIASTLANLASEDIIDDPAAPEVYGLGEAARLIQFRVGSETHALQIGSEAPVGGNIYVATDASPRRVVTVAAFRVSSFERDLDSLRDRRVLNFDRTQVERLVAGWPGGSVTLEKSDDGWSITHPAANAGPADQKAVDDMLSDVAFLRAEGFVDDDPGADVRPEAEPYFTLRLGLIEKEGQPLEIGLRVKSNPEVDGYLVRGGEPSALYRVPAERIEGFPREIFAYRFKELSNFDVADVSDFELEFSEPSEGSSQEPVIVRVQREGNSWKASGEAWETGMAAALIAEFARLEAISVEAEIATPDRMSPLGLIPPRVALRAFGNKSTGSAAAADSSVGPERIQLAEVFLGHFDPSLGIVAQAGDQEAIFRIDPALAEQIPVSLSALHDRFLAPPPAEPAGEAADLDREAEADAS